jgi:hypothetical protein
MAALPHQRRSQQVMRLPVDHLVASLILVNGERVDAILFLPPGEEVARALTEGDPFLPVALAKGIRLVARTAIACIGIPAAPPKAAHDGDLPTERQVATVMLRGGAALEGELRWTGGFGANRTCDYLNEAASHVELHASDTTWYVAKSQIAWVEEAA